MCAIFIDVREQQVYERVGAALAANVKTSLTSLWQVVYVTALRAGIPEWI